MHIGELAATSGVPAKTIRYYEAIGVLDPPERTPSGYRHYDGTAWERLEFVRAAQTAGLTLGEIREIVALRARGVTPCTHGTELIERRSAEITQRIAELQRMKGELVRLAVRARSLDPKDCKPSAVCHIIGPGGPGGSDRS